MRGKKYGVKELSALSGVSIRTLHHYDKIELLKPSVRTEAGYRLYEDKDLLRLQQILFYKELGFPLKEIKALLDDEDFDLIKALREHEKELLARRRHISTLLTTIKHTIKQLKKGGIMNDPEKLYEGLPEEFRKEYREEAINEWGQKAIQRSEKALSQMGKAGMKALQKEMEEVNMALFELKNEKLDSEQVQELIARHYHIIRQFWGTSQLEDSQKDAYEGLGDLYINDDRYMRIDGIAQPEFASFMAEAMKSFAKHNL
ncbi:MAG: MerR family transcriptional regulator [Bacteroidia bacterium]|nr:MerR family transcriptional regulator [Bacteroidia bacterium]